VIQRGASGQTPAASANPRNEDKNELIVQFDVFLGGRDKISREDPDGTLRAIAKKGPHCLCGPFRENNSHSTDIWLFR